MTSPTVLPQDGKKNVLVTSALPYVNNHPHLGNIVGSVLSADVFARFSRLRGNPTLYICGTDEYGTATETKALEDGVTPKELCDKYHALHADVYSWFEIAFDYFGRTTTQQQTEIAQDIFLKLHRNGYLEEKTTVQPYCEQHSSFLADRFVEGECPRCGYDGARGDQCDRCGHLLDPFDLVKPRCKLDGATPVPRETKHVHLLLDKLQPAIEEWSTKASDEGAWSKNGRLITESWLKEGLKDRGITRDLKWGTPVPLPGYEDKVLYVWFDACIGYVSITANLTEHWEKWWRDPDRVKLYQFLGKDNVPFHTVIFPASQMGTGDSWTMLHHLSTTEYLNYESGKFSKSRGIGVFGNNARDTGVPPSVWRYYLLSSRPETGDTQFEWRAFILKNNSELLANLGNFVNRLVKFANAKYDSTVPEYGDDDVDNVEAAGGDVFASFKHDVQQLLGAYVEDLEAVRLRSGLERAMAISSRGNQFLQDNKLDNNLLTTQPGRAAAVVGLGLNLVYLLASLVHPYMPSTARSMTEQLRASLRPIGDTWDARALPAGHRIGKAAYLFSRIDDKKEAEWRQMYGGTQAERLKKEQDAAKKAAKKAKSKTKKVAAAAPATPSSSKDPSSQDPSSEQPSSSSSKEPSQAPVLSTDDLPSPPPNAVAVEKGMGQLNVAD
ncbi:MAG: putative methionine--tRNA ligase, cytoplasmic protein rar1 [Lichina confinis]|nr:MAG: putative methionine--tRNA ligase, cytoplasmic protein rar1 [Lichina confinis]